MCTGPHLAVNQPPNKKGCELCERPVAILTKHHLIPRALHHKRKFRKLYSRQYMLTEILWLCKSCHSFIHKVLSEQELALNYCSRDKLLSEPQINRFVQWLSVKSAGFMPTSRASVRRRR